MEPAKVELQPLNSLNPAPQPPSYHPQTSPYSRPPPPQQPVVTSNQPTITPMAPMMPMQQQQQQQTQQQVVVVTQPQPSAPPAAAAARAAPTMQLASSFGDSLKMKDDTGFGTRQNVYKWSSQFFGCFEDCHSCMYAFFCHPCFLCSVAYKTQESVGGLMCFGLINHLLRWPIPTHFPLCPNIYLVALRAKLRGIYGIKGTICNDIVAMTFCEFCAVTQMMRELKHIGAV